MLERTAARGRRQVECIHADATSLPVDDGTVEAVDEIARVLLPGGRLVGAVLVPTSGRAGLLIRPNQGGFGAMATVEELREWMEAAGLTEVETDRRGAFADFTASRSSL